MANTKISALSDGGALQATDALVVARSGANYKVSGSQIASGQEIAAVEVTSNVTVTSTSTSSPTDIISLGAQTYDGNPVMFDFFAPAWDIDTQGAVIFLFMEGSTVLHRWGDNRISPTGNSGGTAKLSYRFTPTSGSHTYKVGAMHTAGTTFVYGGTGTGGASAYGPIQLRATSVLPKTVPAYDGWQDAGETWTYAAADDPTFTFTVSGDLTTKYTAGMKVKLTQTTAKYFIITKVAYSSGTTTITIYGGTDYDLANAAITSPFYSTAKSPFNFPLSPAKWTETVTSTADDRQSSPTSGVWYNDSSLQISVPIGIWNFRYSGLMVVTRSGSSDCSAAATLSTANNSESDANWTSYVYIAQDTAINFTLNQDGVLSLTSKTTHFLNVKTDTASMLTVGFYGVGHPSILRAVCAYL